MVGKEFIKALKKARSLALYRDDNGQGNLSVIVEDKICGQKVDVRLEYPITVNTCVYAGIMDLKYNKHSVITIISIYDNSPERTALDHIKVGDDIRFEVRSSSSENLEKNNTVVESVIMIITRKDKTYRYLLESYAYDVNCPVKPIRPSVTLNPRLTYQDISA